MVLLDNLRYYRGQSVGGGEVIRVPYLGIVQSEVPNLS